MELDPDIVRHYVQGVERDRLNTWGRLEAERTRIESAAQWAQGSHQTL